VPELPAPASRRERLRTQTLQELKAASLAEVRERGAVGLSLRSVARRLGMSPAGLYRYVDSREQLLTLLIADGYHDLADHLLVALGTRPTERTAGQAAEPEVPLIAGPDRDVAERIRAVALAYRAWSVAHPNLFGLLFGDPIPGYHAPPGGPTVEAMNRFGRALAQPLIEAWEQGRLRSHPALDAEELAAPLAPMGPAAGELPAAVLARLLLSWGRLHGQVSLEVFGHHHWLMPEGCERLFRADVEVTLRDLGVC